MNDRLRAIVREPVAHFVLIGAVAFAIDGWVSPREADEPASQRSLADAPREPIVVDAGVRERLVAQWTNTHPAPPTDEELRSLVQGWIDQEVLYREGLRRGLDEGDLQIRERVASQMAYVLQSRITIPVPNEEDLRAWFQAHAARYARPERVDFTQVFVDGTNAAAEARARELLGLLQGGADPDGLGDRFSGGRRFRGRKLADLAVRFGDAFVDGMDAQPPGTWVLRRSTVGIHVVRLDRWTVGEAPRLQDVGDQVRHDWEQAQRASAIERATVELRAGWEIVESP
ncbi:peptidylprolyl isomerase [Paraliomyxa miuraensis]|uniref:peptidylprolyl isomerase n=1 Tax=Paraliomyxa miuraensis TaxID=376150 RepID=UPI00224EE676|nr:peptidylprolyl isomerase [Paraliomyxa miuraensis]MCX4247918.1 peptidylprolyl isomerase [Paraliomyxa miuraensis]